MPNNFIFVLLAYSISFTMLAVYVAIILTSYRQINKQTKEYE